MTVVLRIGVTGIIWLGAQSIAVADCAFPSMIRNDAPAYSGLKLPCELGVVPGAGTISGARSAGEQMQYPLPLSSNYAPQSAPAVVRYLESTESNPFEQRPPTPSGTATGSGVPRPVQVSKWTTADTYQLSPEPNSEATTRPTISNKTFVPPQGHTFNSASNSSISNTKTFPGLVQQFGTPGGIALRTAAAERLALKLDVDAVAFGNGNIILSGTPSGDGLDASLFLTTLRLACDQSDPSFSLDPPNGAAWTAQSREAGTRVLEHLKDKINPENAKTGLHLETIWVQRDMPSLWAELGPQYPELRSQLVFRPDWLRHTRVGDILYRADVLLKELSVGVPFLQPNGDLRASSVPNYISADRVTAAQGLLEFNSGDDPSATWKGLRLWFDLVADSENQPAQSATSREADEVRKATDPKLYATLRSRGLIAQSPSRTASSKIFARGPVADLSGVFPKMLVRKHDQVRGVDLPGSDPVLDGLSSDVNSRIVAYNSAYSELRDLTLVFRAYVASVKLVQDNQQICSVVKPLSLTDGERISTPLPEFRPSDLVVTVARYATGKLSKSSLIRSTNGGIALRGRVLLNDSETKGDTPLINEVARQVSTPNPLGSWNSASGRRYVALSLDARPLPPRVPIVLDQP